MIPGYLSWSPSNRENSATIFALRCTGVYVSMQKSTVWGTWRFFCVYCEGHIHLDLFDLPSQRYPALRGMENHITPNHTISSPSSKASVGSLRSLSKFTLGRIRCSSKQCSLHARSVLVLSTSMSYYFSLSLSFSPLYRLSFGPSPTHLPNTAMLSLILSIEGIYSYFLLDAFCRPLHSSSSL